jgi:hypothetical protein
MFNHSSNSVVFPAPVIKMTQLNGAIAIYMNRENSISSQQQRYLGLAHAAIEHALYFLEIDEPHRATAHLKFASQQFRFMASDGISVPS